jgi:peptidoglycan hydrolase CwlO-like protein
MSSRISKICLSFLLVAAFILPTIFCFAQLSPVEERKLLEEELKNLEEQISQYEKDITKTQQEKKTLQNQISILKKKISKLDLQIQQSNVMIQDLSLQIKDTEASIGKTSLKIEDSKEKLSYILRAIYEEDQKSLIEVLLSESEISDFFDNLVALESLNTKNQELLENIKSLKSYLESQKQSLDEEKDDLEKMLEIQLLQKQENQDTKKEQESILEKTKGKESEYQKLLTETQKKAQEIRARIFELIGVPKAPTFGEAYEIAKYVETLTGVRPAFLLAILTQESNIGKNVGQCYLVDTQTGEGVRIQTGKIAPKTMSPTRDVPYFLSITQELGRDPFNTPVSCPMEYGWGGAMGPAQFIPSTWMRYRDRIKAITGKAADPWDIKDAFLAAALYLSDYGAGARTRDAEWKAAMIYFSGTVNTKYRFYGDSVLSLASQYEDDIEAIERGSLTQR